jgi:hypothetical protein
LRVSNFVAVWAFAVSAACSASNSTGSPSAGKASASPETAPRTTPSAETTAAAKPETPSVECPAVTKVTALETTVQGWATTGPHEVAGFTLSSATLDKEGKKLTIRIGNKLVPLGQLVKGDGIVEINIREKDKTIAPGVYLSGSETFGKAHADTSLYAEKQAIGWALKGSVNLVKMSDGKVCGTFDMKGEFEDGHKLQGAFVADLAN